MKCLKIFLLLIFLILPLFTYAQPRPPGWSTHPEHNLGVLTGSDFYCLVDEDTGVINGQGIGCRCGHTIVLPSGRPVTVTCEDRICSGNEYNPYGFSVCVHPAGWQCQFDSSCEGGTICKGYKLHAGGVTFTPGVCTVDTGEDELTGVVGTTTRDPFPLVRNVINVLFGFLGILTVLFILYGVVFWLTSTGNEERVQKGKHIVIWAIIGAVIISVAWTLTTYVIELGRGFG